MLLEMTVMVDKCDSSVKRLFIYGSPSTAMISYR